MHIFQGTGVPRSSGSLGRVFCRRIKLYITTQLIAHAGAGKDGSKTRPYRQALTDMLAIYKDPLYKRSARRSLIGAPGTNRNPLLSMNNPSSQDEFLFDRKKSHPERKITFGI